MEIGSACGFNVRKFVLHMDAKVCSEISNMHGIHALIINLEIGGKYVGVEVNSVHGFYVQKLIPHMDSMCGNWFCP